MVNYDDLLIRILRGISDSSINFNSLRNLLKRLGFSERIKGSHHIFFKDGIDEIINLQAIKSKAKAYQIKQVRNIILKYNLGGI